MRLTINGKSHEVDVDPTTPLLWVIREQVGLTGTKYGCGVAQCGACTVHMNGLPVRSCSIPVSAASGAKITTIEGLASGKALHKVQKAWIDHDVPQCGYCQSGMIMAGGALLRPTPNPGAPDPAPATPTLRRAAPSQRGREATPPPAKPAGGPTHDTHPKFPPPQLPRQQRRPRRRPRARPAS